ncbi:MAG: 6-carboxytetrahydropterin synthase [Terriglobia bacterium]|jgi:6-pyruvoyltetrahydropterin/6-carboxytetrahydropterin synthase
MVYLTRRYRFSASHRLHSEALSDEANLRIYGKCDSPFGHGHNYALEVTVTGPVDQETGMVFDLVALDGIVGKEVLERFDLANLNLDVEEFRSRVPTTENVCERIFHLLDGKLQGGGPLHAARLARVRLEETSSNFFEYEGDRGVSTHGPVQGNHPRPLLTKEGS